MEELIKRLERIEQQNAKILELLEKKKPQPSKEQSTKTIEDRRKDFKMVCWNTFKDTLSTQTIKEFFEYWSEHSVGGKKMRFEKEDVFDLKRRMDTWLRNSKKVMPSTNGASGLNIGN